MKNIFSSWRKFILKIFPFTFFLTKNSQFFGKNFEILRKKSEKSRKIRDFFAFFFRGFFVIFSLFFLKNFKIFPKNFRKIFAKKKVTEEFSKSNFSMMKKYFSSKSFSNIKSYLSAFQCTQLELRGVSERETATGIIH